jgi:bcr-type benzoyl-CoA reductase subunit C
MENHMNKLEPFHKAVNHLNTQVSDIWPPNKNQDRKIIGYLCSYAPEELIYAAGFHPLRLFSSKSAITLADNHLQSYCCSLVRGILEDSLSGKLDFLHGMVFPHTCDSIQRLSDMIRISGRYKFFTDVVLPVKLNTDSAQNYMIEILKQFKSKLESASGRSITDDDIRTAIRIFNKIRKKLSAIYTFNAQNPGIISANDLYALVRGAMIMDREKALDLLSDIASELEKKDDGAHQNSKRLLLSGSVCDIPSIFNTIEEAGGVVVGDDLCSGSRWFEHSIDEDEEPIRAIAARYLSRINCPAKHSGLLSRADTLISQVRKNRADGVVFLFLKFCDPHAFDYPYLKEALEKEGIKSLKFEVPETDDQQQSHGQFSTRIETFVQML